MRNNVPPAVEAGHDDKSNRLDKIYFCKECKAVFLFVSDVEDHEKMMGHTRMEIVPLG